MATTTTPQMSLLEAERAFWKVQERYAEFGAADSEPTWAFERMIEQINNGYDARLPRTIRDWQLFDREILGKPGAGEAARALTRAAKVAASAARRERRARRGW